MTDMSSAPDFDEPRRSLTRVPAWVPISAFIGTSLALAIPLVMLRRQRAVLQMTLKDSNPPPPRRVASTPSFSPRRPASLPASSKTSLSEHIFSSDPDRASLNMMSALSHANASSAMLAAKAFLIATGIVAIGGTVFVWGVKETLGVQDAREFGNTMRRLLLGAVPSLPSAIYRPPQTAEERQEVAPFDVQEHWRWEDAEKRLKRAYEEGGISLWGQMALRELEAEARLERERREEPKSRDASPGL